jgi:hypothetical protein
MPVHPFNQDGYPAKGSQPWRIAACDVCPSCTPSRPQHQETIMTLAEFKAWFEGFTEDMEDAPNEKQWERIKARVKDIDGVAVTREVYVDRYWPRYLPYSQPLWSSQLVGAGSLHSSISANAGNAMQNHAASAGNSTVATNMSVLGKADYEATKAA